MNSVRRSSLPPTLYGRARAEVLREPRWVSLFVVSSGVHALAQGAVALAVGGLGKVLAVGPRGLERWLPLLPPVDARQVLQVGFVAVAVKGVAATVSATAQSRWAQGVGNRLRVELARRLLEGGAARPGPAVLARLTLAVRDVERGVDEGLLSLARASAQLVPLAGALAWLSPRLFVGAVLVLVPFAWLLGRVRRAWRGAHGRSLELLGRLHEGVDELVRHIDLWRTYGAGERVGRLLEETGGEVARAASRVEGARAALSAANEVLAVAALVVAVGAARAAGVSLADGTLASFAAAFFLAYRPLRDLGDARAALGRGEVALAWLLPVAFDPGTPEAVAASAPQLGAAARRWPLALLQVCDVGVRRQGLDLPTTSFEAAPGALVAVVGPTGAGKTTLLRAMLGLEPEGVGVVRYAGEPLAERAVGPDARPFAWVPQDAPVLDGSLADNVLPRGGDGALVRAALDAVGAADLAERLGAQRLGASGRALSGGERRWVALARAFASEAPVLLVDEPTVGLDEAARSRVVASLRALRGRRTLVVVTHDPDVARVADQVVRLT